MNAHWWTLLPVRGIAGGKSRLAAVLGDERRAALNRYLLAHTLEVLEHWRGDLRQCLVVSPCDEALAIAGASGALALREPGAGLNAALALGAEQTARRGAHKLMIVACDLPNLTADALAALAQLAEGERHAAIAPDRAGCGTNALALDADARELFQFGEASCARHRAALERGGYQCALCDRVELAFDLDTPPDHAEWMARPDAKISRGFAGNRHTPFAEAAK